MERVMGFSLGNWNEMMKQVGYPTRIPLPAIGLFPVLLILSVDWAVAGENRDLSKYDKLGPYELTRENKADWPRYEGTMRDFIWSHLRKRRRGVLSVTSRSVDAWRESTFYVESGTKNQWCVRIESKSQWAGPPFPDGTPSSRAESRQIEAYKIERVEPTKEHHRPPVIIPKNATRGGETFELEFYDENGQVVYRL